MGRGIAVPVHGAYTRKQDGGRLMSKGKKKGDIVFDDGRADDIIILVMGATGSGKSTFINALLGKDLAVVGHDFESGTSQIQHFIPNIPYKFDCFEDRRLIVIDTPGFDDICVTEEEVVKRISAWLAYSYAADKTIAGIIYLQDISQPRIRPSSKRNVEIFRSLCRTEALSAIVLATTKWEEIRDKQVGANREEQLRDILWHDLIAAGSSVCRFRDTTESAWQIVNEILREVEEADSAHRYRLAGGSRSRTKQGCAIQ